MGLQVQLNNVALSMLIESSNFARKNNMINTLLSVLSSSYKPIDEMSLDELKNFDKIVLNNLKVKKSYM